MRTFLTSTSTFFVTSLALFFASLLLPYFIAAPGPKMPPKSRDYIQSPQQICGLATTPNTDCVANVIRMSLTRDYPEPEQCATPEVIDRLLSEKSMLRRLDRSSIEGFCSGWQTARPRYRVISLSVFLFGWIDFSEGNFWAWPAFPLWVVGVIFIALKKRKLGLILSGSACAVGLFSFGVSDWSYYTSQARLDLSVVSLGVGYWLWQGSLAFAFVLALRKTSPY